MRLTFCGVRGSTPAPGTEFVRYGGHTSCVALSRDGDEPTLVLDGGTGLQRLTTVLAGAPFRGTLLLGHLHWDHTHGMPFFASGALPGSRVDVVLPDQLDPGVSPEDVLARAFSPPHFPIRPAQLGDGWSFRALQPGRLELEGFDVLAREIPHRGGRTFGYRVTDGNRSIAYLSDHSPLGLGPGPQDMGEFHDAALELADGVDVLIHDAQHLCGEFPRLAFLGHSTVDYAVQLGALARCQRVVLFHHDPRRTDTEIDELLAAARNPVVSVSAAAEGMIIDLPATSAATTIRWSDVFSTEWRSQDPAPCPAADLPVRSVLDEPA